MSETFCGKSCENCEKKLELNCEGCKKPWGSPANEDCEIAVCCHGKGHETCETCAFSQSSCGKVREREDMAYYRLRRRDEEARRRADWSRIVDERAELMSKWCAVLFWVVIGAEISGLLGSGMVGQSLAVIFGVAYGAALLQLTTLTPRYRTAGLCALAAAVVVLLMGVLPVNGEGAVLTLLITVPGSVVALVGDYYEFHAHAEMLTGLDDDFAGKWKMLWKWNLRMLFALFGGVFLLILVPTLGALAVVAATVGILVLQVMKIVYLYRLTRFFRECELL